MTQMQNSNTNDREVVDEAAQKYSKEKFRIVERLGNSIDGIMYWAFIAGAEWQSQQQALPLTDDELDEVLAYCEDFTHGEMGDKITMLRKKIATAKANRGSYTLGDIEKAFEAGAKWNEDDNFYLERGGLHDTPNKEQYIASLKIIP